MCLSLQGVSIYILSSIDNFDFCAFLHKVYVELVGNNWNLEISGRAFKKCAEHFLCIVFVTHPISNFITHN